MKKLMFTFVFFVLAAIPFGLTAQTITFSTNTMPGVTVTTSPYGTGFGLNTGLLNIVYSSNGFYDCYGHYHKAGHRHYHNQHYCKACEKHYKKIRKEAEKRYKNSHPAHNNGHNHGYGPSSAPRPGKR